MRLLKWIWSFLFRASKEFVKLIEPTLYYDELILFKNAPLIGKVFHQGKQMFRVVHKERGGRGGRWKCQLELI